MATTSKGKAGYERDATRAVFRRSGLEVTSTDGQPLDLIHLSEKDIKRWAEEQTKPELIQSFLKILGVEYTIEPETDAPADENAGKGENA